MEIKKTILISLGILSWFGILSWCTKEEIKSESNEEITINQNDDQNQTLDNKTKEGKQISILDGCIWCGRCIQIAPNNFTMLGKKATVISQENINSQEIKIAIDRCPVRVIEIL